MRGMERPVAKVAVDLPLANLDRAFDYAVPDELDELHGQLGGLGRGDQLLYRRQHQRDVQRGRGRRERQHLHGRLGGFLQGRLYDGRGHQQRRRLDVQ